ncbi:MAG: sulfotransferase domain-containing protein [Candidatus Sulfotelmatobacter sp.]
MSVQSTARFLRLRARTTHLRLPLVWARHTVLKSNDAFVASYPRSGNTWARFLLCEVLTGNNAEFDKVAFSLPPLRLRSRAPSVLSDGGRLFRTHEQYHFVYKKAIYFVRDPRDVAVSNYEFERVNDHLRGKNLDEFMHMYVRGKVNSFGSWQGHVRSWLDSALAATDNFLLVRYEDMRRDTERELARMLEFLGFSVAPEKIRMVVENNSLQHMRQKEDRYQGRPPEDRLVSEAGRQVRTGSVGGWRDRLTPAQASLIEHASQELMARLGYAAGLNTDTASTKAPFGETQLPDSDVVSGIAVN